MSAGADGLPYVLGFTIPELLGHTKISRAHFYDMVKEGRGPRLTKIGRRTFIRREAAEQWLRQLENESNPITFEALSL